MDELQLLQRIRRSIHRRPELGHNEFRTSRYIKRLLCASGLAPFELSTNSLAVIVGKEGRTPSCAFRAELDGIPVAERSDRDYRSRNDGVMHACGHDGHVAILIALAGRLLANPTRSPVLLVFQQAEESYPSGAQDLLHDLADSVVPEWFYAFHLWPELPSGTIGIHTGPVFPSVCAFTIELTGRPGRDHGSDCDSGGTDALAAAADIYRRVRGKWEYRHPERVGAAVNIGTISAGTRPNRVAENCEMQGTIRAVSSTHERAAIQALDDLVREVAMISGHSVLSLIHI